jgi:hypothetical protein
VRVLIVEDEPFMAEAIRDGPRWDAIASDIARVGVAAVEFSFVEANDTVAVDAVRGVRGAWRDGA